MFVSCMHVHTHTRTQSHSRKADAVNLLQLSISSAAVPDLQSFICMKSKSQDTNTRMKRKMRSVEQTHWKNVNNRLYSRLKESFGKSKDM